MNSDSSSVTKKSAQNLVIIHIVCQNARHNFLPEYRPLALTFSYTTQPGHTANLGFGWTELNLENLCPCPYSMKKYAF